MAMNNESFATELADRIRGQIVKETKENPLDKDELALLDCALFAGINLYTAFMDACEATTERATAELHNMTRQAMARPYGPEN